MLYWFSVELFVVHLFTAAQFRYLINMPIHSFPQPNYRLTHQPKLASVQIKTASTSYLLNVQLCHFCSELLTLIEKVRIYCRLVLCICCMSARMYLLHVCTQYCSLSPILTHSEVHRKYAPHRLCGKTDISHGTEYYNTAVDSLNLGEYSKIQKLFANVASGCQSKCTQFKFRCMKAIVTALRTSLDSK